jgi:signal transduction histidine kinase
MEQVINGLKMKSLVNRTLSQFLICAAVLFLFSIPLFYLLTKGFYAEDITDILKSIHNGKSIPSLDLGRDIKIGMLIQFSLIFIILSVSLLITMRFITHNIWRPFDDTLYKIEQFNLAQNEIPDFMPTKIKEFEQLNEAIYKLMKRDKDSYRIQKEFTENASHELQTPIAIICSKLDLLMQEDLTEKQTKLVSGIYDINTRMRHLNRSLLLLAKIENSQYNNTEKIDISEFVNSSLNMFEAIHVNTSIKLINKSNHKLIIVANRILLECMFNNLIVNSIRHSMPKNKKIEIELGDNYISVSNNGSNKALDENTLFQRFHSSEDNKEGHGLGLSIVKAICDYHRWIINYSFLLGKHTFTVMLKNEK